jgi:Cu(I)/Ag(I) efflux system membrane fusion protein
MLAEEGGRFRPVEVTLGDEIGNDTVILSGLTEGKQVIVSGQFLIDSEASLMGLLARADERPAAGSPGVALHEAEATIEEIGDSEVTISHGPFKTLAMPGMTMPFPLARPELLQGFKVGDRVRVGVRQSDDGLVVESIRSAGDKP